MTVIANVPNIRPIVLMDFSNSGGVPPLLKCVRASSATFVDRDGYIRMAQPNSPRITHDGSTLACLGLLAEAGQANMFSFSEDLSNVAWIKTGVTTSYTADKVGILQPNLITETAETSEHSVSRNIKPLLHPGGELTVQAFFQPGTSKYAIFGIQLNNTHRNYIKINLQTGKWLPGVDELACQWTVKVMQTGLVHVILSTNTSTSPEAVEGQCYLKIAKTSITTSLDAVESAPPIFAGSTSAAFSATGLQLVQNPLISSYIPTGNGLSSIRAADNIQLDGIRLPTEYTVICDHTLQSVRKDTSTLFTLFNPSDTTNNIRFTSTTTGNNWPKYGATDLSHLNVPTQASLPRRRAGLAVTPTQLQAAVNGVASAPFAYPTLVRGPVTLQLSATAINTSMANGTINRIIIYPRALTSDQLTQATYIHT